MTRDVVETSIQGGKPRVVRFGDLNLQLSVESDHEAEEVDGVDVELIAWTVGIAARSATSRGSPSRCMPIRFVT